MSGYKIFIREAGPVNADGTCSVTLQKVTTLDHEVLNDAVERGVLVPLRLSIALPELPGAELAEIFCRLWCHICK